LRQRALTDTPTYTPTARAFSRSRTISRALPTKFGKVILAVG
jgi:hypothetical protein